MESKTVTVPAINCGHCVHTIQTEVSDLAGVKSVQADQASKQVTIQWESPATWQQIETLMREINYAPSTDPNVELR
jgi:copper chaperone CopZ